MPHGTPDWGVTNADNTTYQMTDLGELAVRLGSPVSYDRRGDVVWWDDFECSLNKWQLVPDGLGSTITASTATARNGQTCCDLHLVQNANSSCQIVHYGPPPALSRVGAEISFAYTGTVDTLELELVYQDGANQHIAIVKYTVATGVLAYLGPAGAYVQLAAGLTLDPRLQLFHDMKLVIDLTTNTWVRVLVDGKSYPVSGAGVRTVAGGGNPLLFVEVIALGNNGGAGDVYIDDVIITQDEP